MASVELNTVGAQQAVRSLRDEIKMLARSLGVGKNEVNAISKQFTAFANAMGKLESKVARLEAQMKDVSAAKVELAAKSKQVAAMQKAEAAAVERLTAKGKAAAATLEEKGRKAAAAAEKEAKAFKKVAAEEQALAAAKARLAQQADASIAKLDRLSQESLELAAAESRLASETDKATARLEKQANAALKRLDAENRKAEQSAKRLSASMARQARDARRADFETRKLVQRMRAFGQGTARSEQQIRRLQRAYEAYNTRLRSGVLTQEQLIRTQTQWENVLKRMKLDTANRGLKNMAGLMQELGASAVFAFGPLSGVGARIIAFGALAKSVGFGLAAITAGIAAAGVAASAFTAKTIRTGIEFDRLRGILRAGTGSAAEAAREFRFVAQTSSDMGLNIVSATEQFGRLTAAARFAGISTEEVRKIFTSISKAGVALRLNASQMEGAFRAIEQMMSKGKVQAEELRGQLGERLPGAFGLAAEAMGVTTSELDKMLEQGEVLAEDLLPKLADKLDETFSAEAAAAAATSWTAAIEGLRTELGLLFDDLDRRTGLSDALVDSINFLKDSFEDLRTPFEPTREELRLLGIELQEAEERLAEFMSTSASEVSEMSLIDQKRFKRDMMAAQAEYETRLQAIASFTQDISLEVADLMSKMAPTDAELARLGELQRILESIREEGRLPPAARVTSFLKAPGFGFARVLARERRPGLPGFALGGMEEERGPAARQAILEEIAKLEFPGVKELQERVADLARSGDEKKIAGLKREMEELVEKINAVRPEKGIPVEMFEEKQIAAVALVRELFAKLIEDVGRVDTSKLTNKIQELLDKELKAQEVLKLRIAGRAEEADEVERMEKALRAAGEGATPALVAGLVASMEVTEDLSDEWQKIKKAQEEAAKALKSQTDKFAQQREELEFQNQMLRLQIAGQDELVAKLTIQRQLKKDYNLLQEEDRKLMATLLAESEKLTEELAKQNEIKNQRASLKEEIDDLKAQNDILTLRIRGEDELADQLETRLELSKRFPGLSRDELLELEALLNRNKELNAVLEEQNELEKVRRELAEDFANTIGQAFEDAVIEGEKLSNVLQALLDDINRIILRVLVTKPLENFLTGVLTGEDLTGSKAGPGGTPFFGGALGALFRSGGSSAESAIAPASAGGGPIVRGGAAAEKLKATTGAVEKLGEAAMETTSASSKLTGGVVELAAEKLTEKVTTATLTSSLLEFQVAVRLATTALQNMAATSGVGGGGGGGLLGGLLGGSIGATFPSTLGGRSGNSGFPSPADFGGLVTAGRQHGGPTGPNSPVLVGEAGPEIFRPNRHGMIEPIRQGGERPIVVNQTMNVTTPDEPGFHRSARSNMRLMGRAARSSLRS